MLYPRVDFAIAYRREQELAALERELLARQRQQSRPLPRRSVFVRTVVALLGYLLVSGIGAVASLGVIHTVNENLDIVGRLSHLERDLGSRQ